MSLQCNDVSHWLSAYVDWSLHMSSMACQITSNFTVCPTIDSVNNYGNIKIYITGHLWGEPLVTGRFPSQRASNPENILITMVTNHNKIQVIANNMQISCNVLELYKKNKPGCQIILPGRVSIWWVDRYLSQFMNACSHEYDKNVYLISWSVSKNYAFVEMTEHGK